MKNRLFPILFLFFFTTAPATALTARDIVEKSDNLPRPKTAESTVTMTIHSKGTSTEKAFTLESMEMAQNDTRTLLSFTRPSRIKLLTHTHPDTEDDQWLMMSSGKVKRISSSSKGKSFVNSHFCYEDLSPRNIDDYTYTRLPDGTVLGEPCYRIEVVKKKDALVYDKLILCIRTSDFFILQVEFFAKGKPFKRLEMHDVRPVDGILTAHRMRMIEKDGDEWTELVPDSITYNTDMPPARFNKEALR
ncbi:outer membrane lipoprotein-sorting protein [Desulfatiferula olefinivorans]